MFYVLGKYWSEFICETPKQFNHLHKYSNGLMAVIIVLGTDVHGGKTVFNGMNMNDIGKRSHSIKHSHGRCVVGASGQNLYEGYIWARPRAVLSFFLGKSIFLHFAHNGTEFYVKYIQSDNRKKYIDDDGTGIFPK